MKTTTSLIRSTNSNLTGLAWRNEIILDISNMLVESEEQKPEYFVDDFGGMF